MADSLTLFLLQHLCTAGRYSGVLYSVIILENQLKKEWKGEEQHTFLSENNAVFSLVKQ